MHQASLKQNKAGSASTEALIAAAIVLVVVTSVTGAMSLYLRAHTLAVQAAKAAFLAEEGMEAARFLRDSGWAANIEALDPGREYGLDFNGSAWSASLSPSYIDGRFVRTIRFDTAYRDGGNDLALSGTADPDARKVTISVSWRTRSSTTTRTLSAYLINLFDN